MLKIDYEGNVAKYSVRAFVLPGTEELAGKLSGIFSIEVGRFVLSNH